MKKLETLENEGFVCLVFFKWLTNVNTHVEADKEFLEEC